MQIDYKDLIIVVILALIGGIACYEIGVKDGMEVGAINVSK